MASNNEVATVVDTFSPATKYDALLLEKAGPGLTEDRATLMFQVLDQLTPQLGVFSPVMKKIRDGMFDAVFSDQYTGSQPAETDKNNVYIQRIPYFTLVKRVYDERHEKSEQLAEQLEIVKEKLFTKQKEYEDSQDLIVQMRQQISELKDVIEEVEMDALTKEGEIQGLESTLSQEREGADQMEHQLKCDITELKEDLEESQGEVQYLRQYKAGYDKLESAFHTRDSLEDAFMKKKKRPVIATKRAHLVSSIESARKLEEQILTVQNGTIEEFDKFMEEHKEELMMHSNDENEVSEDYMDQHIDLDGADQQLMIIQERFQKSMEETQRELDLLRQHRAMLQEQLQVLEENKPQINRKKSRKSHPNILTLDSRPVTQESDLSAGLEEEGDEDPSSDPFIPQERIFSKYAAMLYSSDNGGKTFHEFKDARFCPSCGEKTVLCPHKILTQEHIFTLPPNSSHLKITRPKVRINEDIMHNLLQTAMSDIACTMSMTPDSKMGGFKMHSRNFSLNMSMMSPLANSKSPEESSVVSMESHGFQGEPKMIHSLQDLWADYKSRTNVERAVPRSLSQDRVFSLISQFAAYLLWHDEHISEDAEYVSILDSLYDYLQQRYLKPEVMYMAAHDFLNTLIDHANSNKVIQLFSHVLVGNFDGSLFRYFLLICDFIDLVEWKSVDEFQIFASAVYPFLNEDDLETLHMGYTAFSENKISKTLIAEYIVYIVLKFREPRFLEMETKLLNHPGKEPGQMTESEFIEATEAVLAIPDDKLRRLLFEEALVSVQQSESSEMSLPITRLAQMTSYLALLQISPIVKQGIIERMEAKRPSSDDSEVTVQPIMIKDNRTQPLLTMTTAKQLAESIAKRDKLRSARMSGYMMQ